MDICIDFDGTCVTHEYPLIGKPIGAEPVLKELVSKGHNLILFTMRSDRRVKNIPGIMTEENYLTEAVNWFRERDIPLFGIQENPTQKEWTDSPKAYGQVYIDDAAIGCPLVIPEGDTDLRPYADWKKLRVMLLGMGLL
jgi:hypothetical protein